MVIYKCAHCEFRNEDKKVVENHIFDEHFYVELRGDVLVVTFRPDRPEPGQEVRPGQKEKGDNNGDISTAK